jgi:hypothetical protein
MPAHRHNAHEIHLRFPGNPTHLRTRSSSTYTSRSSSIQLQFSRVPQFEFLIMLHASHQHLQNELHFAFPSVSSSSCSRTRIHFAFLCKSNCSTS